ncbi:MAG: DNA-3-methyladenine glycosylase 2 family protein [Bacteroidetes bacterium]|nr:DNA-3-methyladenine glycosylase 2 family protein [Bacteroidota bacterium]
MLQFTISTPAEFSFDLCLDFLLRSPKEVLHSVSDKKVYKAITINDTFALLELSYLNKGIHVTVLNSEATLSDHAEIEEYVQQWFDLKTNLMPFYAMARKDKLLAALVDQYFGYRIVGQPDLFESLVWAVIGQQINLSFAYTLKQRFVEGFGRQVIFSDRIFYLFPTPTTVAELGDDDLLPLQFSKQKSKYVIEIAKAFTNESISKESIGKLSFESAKEKLMSIKGIGNWTANYALMKTFRYPNAFPLEDAGIHNAIKNLKRMKSKPTLDQVRRIFKKYKGWEAYATLYLWKSL